MSHQLKQRKKEFNTEICDNLYPDELSSLKKIINDLCSLNQIKLLDKEADDLIDKAYSKYVSNGTLSLQLAISKIYATINDDSELSIIYADLSANLYMFFKQLKNIIDKDMYNMYVNNDKLNIHSNFDKTLLKVICYNKNIFEEK